MAPEPWQSPDIEHSPAGCARMAVPPAQHKLCRDGGQKAAQSVSGRKVKWRFLP